MEEDNLSRQIDEVEALSSIYGSDWHTEDESRRIYSIEIHDEQTREYSLTLQVTLLIDYPRHAPPHYQLSAPWLRGQERRQLDDSLEEIYHDNKGDSIVYLWVERIREFVEEKATAGDPAAGSDLEASARSSHTEALDSGVDTSQHEASCGSPSTAPAQQALSPVAEARKPEEDIRCPEIYHGEKLHDRKSVFVAHLAAVEHQAQVKMVLEKLCEDRKVAAATHNIYAYRISPRKGSDIWMSGCEDDGEIHAGSRMLHLLQIVDAVNVIVVVTRWYGGVHLGPDRFKHISHLTREMLETHNYIKEKANKKGPKTSKSNKKGK